MDYTKLYVGDEVLYQGQLCGTGSVIRGNVYRVIKEAPKKGFGFIIDEHGGEKLVQMGFNYAKIGGR